MYYELYVDSLFLVNFVMNLLLLLLVNKRCLHTATCWRLMSGAAIGAMGYVLPIIWNVPIWLKVSTGVLLGIPVMIVVAFSIHNIRAFLYALEKLFGYSFLMGGLMIFLIRNIPWFKHHVTGIFGLLGVGGIGYLILDRRTCEKKSGEHICKATLVNEKSKLTVIALIDSGNSLIEPISGKPVSIIEKKTFLCLWRDAAPLYRVIPYHSIGKTRGILQGYLLPELRIEVNGMVKVCKDVYVAVSDESICGDCMEKNRKVKMILHPALL